MKHGIKALVWLALLPFAGLGQSEVLSLDTVLSRINRHNPMLKEYDSRARAMEKLTEGSRSWMAPMIGGGTFMTPYPGQSIEDPRDEGFWMISAEQQIPNPGKLKANQQYYSSRASVETHGRAWQYNELRAKAKSLYYELVTLERKEHLLLESVEIVDWMLKVAEVRYPYNQSGLREVFVAQGRKAEVENMVIMNEGDIADRKAQLAALMNQSVQADFSVDTTAFPALDAFTLPDTAALGGMRSDIRRIDHSVEVMRLSQQLQRAQAKPDFRIRFDHMSPFSSMMPSAFTLMGMVSIPIAPWSSKMYQAETQAIDYEIQAMRQERESILTETQAMLFGMRSRITQMRKQLDNYQLRIIPALTRSYDAAKIAYEENRGGLSEIIDAWEGVNMAQIEYLNRLNEYYQMVVSYEKETEK